MDRRRRPQPDGSTTGVVAGHALLAIGWFCLSALVVAPSADRFGVSVASAAAVAGIAYVVLSSLALVVTLARWRVRAAAEARTPTTPAEMDRVRSMFLAAVSHELRTPVTNLVGYAETLRRHHAELSSEQVELLTSRLVANGEDLERLVLDLLTLHPGSAEQRGVERSAVDVDALLPALASELVGTSHVVDVRSSAGTALLDEHALRRIVAELLDNAVRHTPAGTQVSVLAERHGGTVLLVVEDDGPGVPGGILGSVADPFVQGLATEHDPTPGLGIGLSLVAHHATRHGGQLQLATAADGGTRATVVLPAPLVIPEATGADDRTR